MIGIKKPLKMTHKIKIRVNLLIVTFEWEIEFEF